METKIFDEQIRQHRDYLEALRDHREWRIANGLRPARIMSGGYQLDEALIDFKRSLSLSTWKYDAGIIS